MIEIVLYSQILVCVSALTVSGAVRDLIAHLLGDLLQSGYYVYVQTKKNWGTILVL